MWNEMKLRWGLLRSTAIVLALLLLLGSAAYAEPTDAKAPQAASGETVMMDETPPAEETPPEEEAPPEDREPTDEELCRQYGIKDNWAKPALLFALRSGLMKGRENGLEPNANTTRAEVATMLIRMLGTESTESLAAFTDVKESAWYYNDLSRAYSLDIINGTSSTTMSPNAAITREQVFVILSRVFGVKSQGWPGFQRIFEYSDWASVSSYAREPLSAMIEAGFVKGSNGLLNPKGSITRQELAQVIYNMTQAMGDTVESGFTGSCVLRANRLPEGAVIHGDVLLVNEDPIIVLDHVTVTGRLVIQGKGYVTLSVNDCSIGELVLCRNTELHANSRVANVRAISPLFLVNGRIGKLTSHAGAVTVYPDALVELAAAQERNIYVVNGRITQLELQALNVTVNGSGSVENLLIYRGGAKVSLTPSIQTDLSSTDLSGVKVTRTDDLIPTISNPGIYVNLKLNQVPAGGKTAIGQVLVEDEAVCKPFLVKLKEGAPIACYVNFQKWLQPDRNKSEVKVKLVLNLDGHEVTRSVSYSIQDVVYEAAKAVHPMNVLGTIRYDTTLYRSSSLSGYITGVSKGTTVTYITYYGTSAAYVQLPNGTRGWIPYGALNVWENTLFYVTWDYSTQVKECYVNRIKQASSKTNYLIWVSTYTQKVNVFYGSKGNWKLQHTFVCATGKNLTPTKIQDTVIQYKTKQWNFSNFYVDSVSNLDSAGRAFHSRPKYYGSGNVYDWTMGCPVSHGCIRMLDDGCGYIYNYVPVNTTVIIY